MKILTIFGARPQFIKAALVSRALRDQGLTEVLVHTDQHYDFNMSDVFFRELDIPAPDYHLGIRSGGHGEQTGRMLMELEKVMHQEAPDLALVYGDTNSTLAGALTAAKLHVPLAHVEAGLRSYNKAMPEEVNRILTDHCSDILFCPTDTAVANLQREGFARLVNSTGQAAEVHACRRGADSRPLVLQVGDVMYDIALAAKNLVKQSGADKRLLEQHALEPGGYILATIHRADNTDDPNNLMNIVEALAEIASAGQPVFFPVHPRTRKALAQFDLLSRLQGQPIGVSEPVSYLEMVTLESNAALILTDSGGVQKEAYFYRVPCVTARKETEWTELIELGWNRLAGSEKASILRAVQDMLAESPANRTWRGVYGNGNASKEIAGVLKSYAV